MRALEGEKMTKTKTLEYEIYYTPQGRQTCAISIESACDFLRTGLFGTAEFCIYDAGRTLHRGDDEYLELARGCPLREEEK